MLQNLHVKNLALIDETEVDFRNGLNILSGETGAGKSIIIGSINLALGEKVQKEMQPGSLFISNSFPVPGISPERVIEVPCTPPRPLYCYQR